MSDSNPLYRERYDQILKAAARLPALGHVDRHLQSVADAVEAGSVLGAISYAPLFFPPLREIDGMVLQTVSWTAAEHEMTTSVKKYLQEVHGDFREVEISFNLVEVGDLFVAQAQGSYSEDEDHLLATILADAWRSWLLLRYPARCFRVDLLGPDETRFEGMGVTFWQVRDASANNETGTDTGASGRGGGAGGTCSEEERGG